MLQLHAFPTSLGGLLAAAAQLEPDPGHADRSGFLADNGLHRSTYRCCRRYARAQAITDHRHVIGTAVLLG